MADRFDHDPASTPDAPTVADLPPERRAAALAWSAARNLAHRLAWGLPPVPPTETPLPVRCSCCGSIITRKGDKP